MLARNGLVVDSGQVQVTHVAKTIRVVIRQKIHRYRLKKALHTEAMENYEFGLII
jgi:hypothetical protein